MSDYQNSELLTKLSLGKTTGYRSDYDPSLLQAVPRSLNRQQLGLDADFKFIGCDVWHAYELSWLNNKGKPVVVLARLTVDANSPNIIESKSLKLYLNSLNQTRFESFHQVQRMLVTDLSSVTGSQVLVELIRADDISKIVVSELPGHCIDDLDINVDDFQLTPNFLHCEHPTEPHIAEILHSHLLKSNCLITDQPDWASVVIRYQGSPINHEGLLRYLISFRLHNEFHEQCVERIYTDIMTFCAPAFLSVQALYTRRGGLDINPFRTSENPPTAPAYRINRQ